MLAAEAADAAADATRPTAAEVRTVIAAGEALAAEKGMHPKTSKVVQALRAKWSTFVKEHGDEYGFDAAAGPTLEFVGHFSTWGCKPRGGSADTAQSKPE